MANTNSADPRKFVVDKLSGSGETSRHYDREGAVYQALCRLKYLRPNDPLLVYAPDGSFSVFRRCTRRGLVEVEYTKDNRQLRTIVHSEIKIPSTGRNS